MRVKHIRIEVVQDERGKDPILLYGVRNIDIRSSHDGSSVDLSISPVIVLTSDNCPRCLQEIWVVPL